MNIEAGKALRRFRRENRVRFCLCRMGCKVQKKLEDQEDIQGQVMLVFPVGGMEN